MFPNFKPLNLDLPKFAIDLVAFRSDNKLPRRSVAKMLHASAHAINAIECKNVYPKTELFYNACLLMGKNPNEYFN